MEQLGIDYKLIIAQIVNFAILYFVFNKFIAKPFLAALAKQKQEDALRDKVTKELTERQHVLDEENAKLAKQRKKILDEAVEKSKSEAEVIKQDMLQAAKTQSDELIQKTQEQLADERRKLIKEMRAQIVDVSMMVVTKAFADYLTPDAQKEMTKKILARIPDDKKLA